MRRVLPARFAAMAATVVVALAALGAAWPGPAAAAEFRGVASSAAILYDGPSERARKLFMVVQGTPLEVISTINQWIKVRDFSGDVLWISRADLGEPQHVIANTLASIRRAPQPTGELVVQIDRGVLLEVVDANAAAGWLRVRHADGAAGFVAAGEVWGR